MKDERLILLTGATGYVGGRLLPLLEQHAYRVRCLTRRPESLQARVGDDTVVIEGDIFDKDSLGAALEGVNTAFYFVHSMGAKSDFVEEDRRAALNFAQAASKAGVERIIYLGGLGNPDHELSNHLRSRQETGDVLRSSSVEVIEFRASIVIGSGSLSFELIRALVERLPIMICPKWVNVLAQPIAIEDLLEYLLAAIELPNGSSRIFEIGGPDQISYGGIMQEYARQRGLKRLMIPVPVLTPFLSSLWLGLVTPIYARIGRKLVESLRNPTLISNNLAAKTFSIRPRGLRQAIAQAIVHEERNMAATRWSDAVSSSGRTKAWGGIRFGSRLVDSRTSVVAVAPSLAFEPIQRIGGTTGWYYADWLWRIRGFFDLLAGGVGMRRGRRDATHLRVGDTLDCWRVEAFDPGHLLRLRAEMKLPGRAWLEFEVTGDETKSTVRQTAIFDPVGLLGLLYWYGIYPLHQLIFAGMLRNIAHAAIQTAGSALEDRYEECTPSFDIDGGKSSLRPKHEISPISSLVKTTALSIVLTNGRSTLNSTRRNQMKAIDVIAAVLLVVGGLNWGLVGLFNFDLVAALTGSSFGETNMLSCVIYSLVGASAIYQAIGLKAIQHRWGVGTAMSNAGA